MMYAIVEVAGKQFRVTPRYRLYIPRVSAEVGTTIDFDRVLLLGDEGGSVRVGSPTVEKAVVSGKVLAHVKGDKVRVFKKKRRKGYRKTQGHRQSYTQVSIEAIKASK